MKANRVFAILLAVVITVVSLAGCAENKNMVPVEFKGLKFSIPEGWEGGDWFYQGAYDGDAWGTLSISVWNFTEDDDLKDFSSWGPDVARVVLDDKIKFHLKFIKRGYEAISTEETQIDGQVALVHRFISGNHDIENVAYYVTGINTTYIFIDASFDDVDDKTVEAEMRSDLDAFIKSIDLSGLD